LDAVSIPTLGQAIGIYLLERRDMKGSFDLERFVKAQNPEWNSILSELREGDKRGHWMWFVFPQLKGLGSSPNANHFGITSRAEAKAYLDHSILGPRLLECTTLVNSVEGRSIEAIFGEIDAMKFRSSVTLFSEVASDNEVFEEAIKKYYRGEADQLTLKMLKAKG